MPVIVPRNVLTGVRGSIPPLALALERIGQSQVSGWGSAGQAACHPSGSRGEEPRVQPLSVLCARRWLPTFTLPTPRGLSELSQAEFDALLKLFGEVCAVA